MPDRSFAEQLSRESETWVAEGIVSAEQAAAIRGRYADQREARRGRATNALAAIGAVAVGFGVIAFVAANWEELSDAARVALLAVAVAGSYAAAYQLRDRSGSRPRVGEALYLVGVLLYGASIFLVGQIYNVEAHDPFGLLLWAGGAVATALVVRSRAIAAAAVLIFTAWVGWEFGVALEEAELVTWPAFFVVALCYGTTLYSLATALQERLGGHWFARSGFLESGRGVGLPVLAAGLFVLTFAGTAGDLDLAGDNLERSELVGVVLLAALAFAAAGVLAAGRRPSARYEGGFLVVALATVVAALFAGGNGDAWAVIFNILFAALAVGIVYVGFLSDEAWLVNLGVAFVAIDLVARYFDVFWEALPRSVGMIGAGLLVLGIAYVLERQRQRLLERMDAA